jgi:bifunctional NMN adenylyltransferase/nudix hydrolase
MQELKRTTSKEGVGVVIGRFQAPTLTEGHNNIIDHANNLHEKLIIVVGLSAINGTKRNPLNYTARRQMIQNEYPNASIVYIKDCPSNKTWSKNLDNVVSDELPPEAKVTLYGSRDSFVKAYSGRYPTAEFEQKVFTSATKIRESVSYKVPNDYGFRCGAIHQAMNQYDSCFPCVDIAVVKRDKDGKVTDLLLGRKNHDGGKNRFPGGFVQPFTDLDDEDYLEANARKELAEECGINLEVGEMNYVGSFRVDDWRYRNETNKIVTTLFVCDYKWGTPEADDDLDEVEWFKVEELNAEMIVDTHLPLLKKLQKKESLDFDNGDFFQ